MMKRQLLILVILFIFPAVSTAESKKNANISLLDEVKLAKLLGVFYEIDVKLEPQDVYLPKGTVFSVIVQKDGQPPQEIPVYGYQKKGLTVTLQLEAPIEKGNPFQVIMEKPDN